MKSMYRIVDELKKLKKIQKTREFAEVFKFDYDTLRNRMSRDSIPFRELLDYCRENDIDVMKLLYEE